jgi:hypothetical protein
VSVFIIALFSPSPSTYLPSFTLPVLLLTPYRPTSCHIFPLTIPANELSFDSCRLQDPC